MFKEKDRVNERFEEMDEEMLNEDEILEEEDLEDDELIAEAEEESENKDPIVVTMVDSEEKIRVEHEDGRFVEGYAYPDFFTDRYMRTIITPPKVRVKGKKDTIAYLNTRYDTKTDQTLYILKRMLTAWSEDKQIDEKNILASKKLNRLFYKFVDKFKEINDMNVEEDEKK